MKANKEKLQTALYIVKDTKHIVKNLVKNAFADIDKTISKDVLNEIDSQFNVLQTFLKHLQQTDLEKELKDF